MTGKGSHVEVMGDSVERTLEAGVRRKLPRRLHSSQATGGELESGGQVWRSSHGAPCMIQFVETQLLGTGKMISCLAPASERQEVSGEVKRKKVCSP